MIQQPVPGQTPTFSFTPQPGQQPQGQDYGAQQYLSQGQAAINPGSAQVAQSSPISAAGTANLAKALAAQSGNQNQQLPDYAAQAALQTGAAMAPNSPSGENMGGVGPTVQNEALAQGLVAAVQNPQNSPFMDPTQPQITSLYNPASTPFIPGQNSIQNYQNQVSGGGWSGGGSN